MRPLIVLVLLSSCGIFGLSAEEQQQLNRYQSQAALYYEGGNMEQAMTQIVRGLEIDAEDYKLTRIQGWILLRRSKANPELLDEARLVFEGLMAQRSPHQQHYSVLLGYGATLQSLGMRNQSEADRLTTAAERLRGNTAVDPNETPRNPEVAVLRGRAGEHRALAASQLQSARTVLHHLLDKGELVLDANFHLMQVSGLLGVLLPKLPHDASQSEELAKLAREEVETAIFHGKACLSEVALAQEITQKRLQETETLSYEKNQQKELWRLRNREIEVRGYLADIHYKQGDYEEAVRHLDIVLRTDPRRSDDYFNRGQCRRKLGQIEAAKADFSKFLATSPLPAGNPLKIEAAKALEAH